MGLFLRSKTPCDQSAMVLLELYSTCSALALAQVEPHSSGVESLIIPVVDSNE